MPSETISAISSAAVARPRSQAIFEIESSIKGGDTASEAIETPYSVEFEHAYLKYVTSNETSLDDIDFKVKKGEVVGVIGGTGSGKTSLVNLRQAVVFYDGDIVVGGGTIV